MRYFVLLVLVSVHDIIETRTLTLKLVSVHGIIETRTLTLMLVSVPEIIETRTLAQRWFRIATVACMSHIYMLAYHSVQPLEECMVSIDRQLQNIQHF